MLISEFHRVCLKYYKIETPNVKNINWEKQYFIELSDVDDKNPITKELE